MNHRPHPRPNAHGPAAGVPVLEGFVPGAMFGQFPQGTSRMQVVAAVVQKMLGEARQQAARQGFLGSFGQGWVATCNDNLRGGVRVRVVVQADRPRGGPWPEAASFGGSAGGPGDWVAVAKLPEPVEPRRIITGES